MVRWYVDNQGEQFGPLPEDMLLMSWQAGRIAPTALVCMEGHEQWVPLAYVPSIAHAQYTTTPQLVQPPREPTEEELAERERIARKGRITNAVIGVGILVIACVGIMLGSGPRLGTPQRNTGGLPDLGGNTPVKKQSSMLGAAVVSCVASGVTSMTCSVKSNGVGPVKACWDVELDCPELHVAHGCSDKLPAGSTASYVLSNFTPPISGDCTAVRVTNLKFE